MAERIFSYSFFTFLLDFDIRCLLLYNDFRCLNLAHSGQVGNYQHSFIIAIETQFPLILAFLPSPSVRKTILAVKLLRAG